MGRFTEAVKRGVSSIQTAYNKQREAMDKAAMERMRAAKTKLKRERIKSELELKRLQLKREMYEAQAAVQQERAAVKEARRRAGVVSWDERLRTTWSNLQEAHSKLQKAQSNRGTARKPVAKSKKSGKSPIDRLYEESMEYTGRTSKRKRK